MKPRVLLAGLLLAGVGGATLASNLAPQLAESRVPEHLRASRWEASYQGRLAREKLEEAGEELPEGVWIDKAQGARRPHLVNAPEEIVACAQRKLGW